jgi:hypothetical protein
MKTLLAGSRDDAVAAAALRGPAFLTGLSDVEVQDYRLRWQRVRHPALAERVDVLRRVVEHLDRGGSCSSAIRRA